MGAHDAFAVPDFKLELHLSAVFELVGSQPDQLEVEVPSKS